MHLRFRPVVGQAGPPSLTATDAASPSEHWAQKHLPPSLPGCRLCAGFLEFPGLWPSAWSSRAKIPKGFLLLTPFQQLLRHQVPQIQPVCLKPLPQGVHLPHRAGPRKPRVKGRSPA